MMPFPWRQVFIFGGIATGIALLGAAGGEVVKAEVKRARDALFEVGPGCEYIKIKQIGADASMQEVENAIFEARKYYFTPTIARYRKGFPSEAYADPMVSAKAIAAAVMKDLFPECQWGSVSRMSISQRIVWKFLGGWLEKEAMVGVTCDPLAAPPEGMMCDLNQKLVRADVDVRS